MNTELDLSVTCCGTKSEKNNSIKWKKGRKNKNKNKTFQCSYLISTLYGASVNCYKNTVTPQSVKNFRFSWNLSHWAVTEECLWRMNISSLISRKKSNKKNKQTGSPPPLPAPFFLLLFFLSFFLSIFVVVVELCFNLIWQSRRTGREISRITQSVTFLYLPLTKSVVVWNNSHDSLWQTSFYYGWMVLFCFHSYFHL